MDIQQRFMTENKCYKQGLKLPANKRTGIMIHSTASPGVMAAAWFDRWNNADTAKLVHAFIDDTDCWQYAPWDMYGAHCGGSANATHVGIEICEDKNHTRDYFEKAWEQAVTLTAGLCASWKLSPENILSHREAHALGLASNHGDPDHWWGAFGRSMDDFRKAVARAMGQETEDIMEAKEKWVKVDPSDTLNIRQTPNGKIIGAYANGIKVTVYETNAAGWCRTDDGWVYGQYLEARPPEDKIQITLDKNTAKALHDALGQAGGF